MRRPEKNSIMDAAAVIWLWVGERFRVRPATVAGVVAGALLLATILTWTVVEQYSITKKVDDVTAAFCKGPDNVVNEQRCQDLLRALLENPNGDNAGRLREIVRDGR